MIDKNKHIFPLMMALLMASMMSGILTIVYRGLHEDFLESWGHAFLIAWPCASVVVFIAIPVARAATNVIGKWLERL